MRGPGRVFFVGFAASCVAGLLGPLVAPASPAAPGAGGGGTAKIERMERHLQRDLKGILAQARAQLIQLALLPSVQAADASTCNADMAARVGSPRYDALGAADLSGDLYCLSPPVTSPVSVADRAYFLRAVGTGDLGVGDYQVGKATGAKGVGLGFPARAGGRITGIVYSPLSLAWLDQRVMAQRKKPARDLLVIDDHGTVLAHAGRTSTSVGTNLGATALIKKALRLDHSRGRTQFGGKKVFAAIDVVPLSGGAIHVAVTGRP